MKKILSLFFALTLIASANAQINTMQFTQTPGVYTEIGGDTTVALATGTTGAASLDDVVYGNNALPFTFTFNGVGHTSFSITTNGFITFGATLPGGTTYSPISSTTAYAGAVGSLANDMQGNYGVRGSATLGATQITGVQRFAGVEVGKVITGTGIPVGTTIVSFNSGAGTIDISAATTAASTNAVFQIASGSIVRGTTGTIGNRVHTIQWKNFRRFGSGDTLENANFQIKLYEANNNIEVVYGSWSGSIATRTCQVGLRGATNADFNNRTTATNWAATTAGALNSSTCTWSSTVFPASGQTYRWSAPLANDVGVTAILSPSNPAVDKGGQLAPKATIKNFGGANQTTPFNITCTISPGGYTSTKSDTLSAGQIRNITFDSTFIPVFGNTYTVTVYTELVGDQNSANDTQTTIVGTIAQNYGSDSGYFYANSNALNQVSYPEACWKDTTGSISLVLNAVTQPGAFITGSLDDGYFRIKLKDLLLATNQDTTGKILKYAGLCWDSLFIGTNGIIGFTQQYGTYSINDFNVDGAQVARYSIQPIWKDMNLGSIVSSGGNRLSIKAKGNQLIITYSKVQAFAPTTDWVSYQVVLGISDDCLDPNMNWRVTFADSLSGTSGSYVRNYLDQYNAASGSVTTFRNWVVGYTATGGVTPYGGFISTGNPFPATPVTAINVKRPIFDKNTGAGLAIEFGPSINDLNLHDCLMLNVLMSLEGLQYSFPPRVRDTIIVTIRDGVVAPYKVMQKQTVLLDSVGNKGRADIEFSLLKRNYNYYITIQHRNSIKSWSTVVSTTGNKLTYDFTTAVTQTYGGNAVVVNGLASFYTGDVTQDGTVDGSDAAIVDNDAFNFVGGDYVLTDLNWDGIVDATDASLADNNAANFIGEVAPPGASSATETLIKYDYVRPTETIVTPDPTMIGIIKNESDAIYPNEKK
jgi:hypothetical protein